MDYHYVVIVIHIVLVLVLVTVTVIMFCKHLQRLSQYYCFALLCLNTCIRQLSSFSAPMLWFIDLTVATCHVQYTFLSLCVHFYLKLVARPKSPAAILFAIAVHIFCSPCSIQAINYFSSQKPFYTIPPAISYPDPLLSGASMRSKKQEGSGYEIVPPGDTVSAYLRQNNELIASLEEKK